MELTLARPDDWHLHVRDGEALAAVIPHTARQFARAIIMPNLQSPVTTTDQALSYRQRILDAVPSGSDFTPLMTLYLTDNTAPEEVATAILGEITAFRGSSKSLSSGKGHTRSPLSRPAVVSAPCNASRLLNTPL